MNKDLKYLSKFIDKYYWKNNQHLLVDSMELRDKHNDFYLDIYIVNKISKYIKYLFEIQTLNMFEDYDYTISSYFRDNKLNQYSTLYRSSYTPLYFNRTFTLKKFGIITGEDILNCTKYFCREVLELNNIWNIKVANSKIVREK